MKPTITKLLLIIPTLVTLLALCTAYFLEIRGLNFFPGEKILTEIHWEDVVVGLTIYLKTSVDFALLIGILMSQYPGVKNRFAIEIGTAVGNALGTMVILVIWYFFKEIKWLLGLMILLAALVLFRLAQTSLEHIFETDEDKHDSIEVSKPIKNIANRINSVLSPINTFLHPLLSRIIPEMKFGKKENLTFAGLVLTSFTIPFILGLDDFAGYVPLFNIVNVFGFGIGVFTGHTILNIFLFINPKLTTKIVKNPIIAIIGSLAFIGLALWGIYEVVHIFNETYIHLGH
jgi:hypothetical protein